MLTITIGMSDRKSAVSLAGAIKSGTGMEHPEYPGLFSEFVSVATCDVVVEFPDPPKPTIPELIAKFHAEPTLENRKALRSALAENKTAFIHDRIAYFAAWRHGVPTIEIY